MGEYEGLVRRVDQREVKEMSEQRTSFGNPFALAAGAFAVAAMFVGLVLARVEGLETSLGALPMVYAVTLFHAGVLIGLATVWLIAVGNTFGAWVAGTFTGFYLSFGFVGIASGVGILKFPSEENLGHVLAIFVIPYLVSTLGWAYVTLRFPLAYSLFFMSVPPVVGLTTAALWDNFDPTLTRAAGIGWVYLGVYGLYFTVDLVARELGLRGLPQGPVTLESWRLGVRALGSAFGRQAWPAR